MPARLTRPEIAIVVSGALWGLYWIPVRYLEARSVGVVWLTLGIFVASLALLVPILIRWPGARAAFTPRMLATGFLTGGGFILYSISIALTEVVNAILLFYLSPVWATMLGRFVLAEHFTGARLVALALGLGGLWVVLGAEGGVPLPGNLGDWFALAAGADTRGRGDRDRPRGRGAQCRERGRHPVGGAVRESGPGRAPHDDGGGDRPRVGRRLRR